MFSRAEGFSLVEVVVAIAIIGSAAVSAIALNSSQLRTVQKVQEHLVAVSLADYKLSELQLESTYARTESTLSGDFEAPFETYSWTAAIGQRSEGRVDVLLRIDWQDGTYEIATGINAGTSSHGRL